MAATREEIEAFLKAAADGDEAAVQQGIELSLLHQTGCGPKESMDYGWSALHWAVHAAKPEIATLLLAAGASVDVRDQTLLRRGRTPLHVAVANCDSKMVEFLLDADANIEAVDANGYTPMFGAVGNADSETLKVLLEKGANVRASSEDYRDGHTALHSAALSGLTEIARMLLDAGADVQATTTLGSTPLHEAALRNHNSMLPAEEQKQPLEIVELLLERGADPTVRDDNGRTARDIALEEQNEEVASLLQGVEEDFLRSRVLTVRATSTERGSLRLVFTTAGGNMAAELAWLLETPIAQLPTDLIAAIRRSGFTGLGEPLTVRNLRLVKQDGTPVTWDDGAPGLADQFGIP